MERRRSDPLSALLVLGGGCMTVGKSAKKEGISIVTSWFASTGS